MIYTPIKGGLYVGYCFNLDAGTGVIHVMFSGELSNSVMLEAYPEVQQLVSANGVRAGIIDFSGVTAVQLTSEFVRFLAQQRPLFPDPIPRVIVAPEDLMFGIARMYQAFGAGTRQSLHIARSLEEAYELLTEQQQQAR